MKAKRRMGVETAKNRGRLIEAAAELMVEEGYAAVTARKVAAKAGLKVQLVYYYFKDMDDLILAVVKRNSTRRLKTFVRILAGPDPLRAIWIMNRDSTSAASTTELLALANHRETIRSEVVKTAKEFRHLQIEAVEQLLGDYGMDKEKVSPAAVVTIIAALSRAMAQDSALGVDEGYPEAIALVERGLDWLAQRVNTDTESDSLSQAENTRA
jgi:AcrR family transcriptional regulator